MSTVCHGPMIASSLEVLKQAVSYPVANTRIRRARYASVSPRIDSVSEAILQDALSGLSQHAIGRKYHLNAEGTLQAIVGRVRALYRRALDAEYRVRVLEMQLRKLGAVPALALVMCSGVDLWQYATGHDDAEIVRVRTSKRSRSCRGKRRDEFEQLSAEVREFVPSAGMVRAA